MEIGNESWKWGLVLILLGVFILVANQAYVAVTSQEDYPPPTDYQEGDSFDIEHRGGPGAGQPMDVPALPGEATGTAVAPPRTPDQPPPIDHPEIDLNQIKNPGQSN